MAGQIPACEHWDICKVVIGKVTQCDCDGIGLYYEAPDAKATNPKDAVGSTKLPLHLWPEAATAFGAIGCLNGKLKYGRTNWRKAGVRASIYADAAKRHINDWMDGEDYDPDDGVHNLAGALACLAIVVDAMCSGTLNDDRNYNPGGSWRKARAMMEPMVEKLKALHSERHPKDWTIEDMDGRPS